MFGINKDSMMRFAEGVYAATDAQGHGAWKESQRQDAELAMAKTRAEQEAQERGLRLDQQRKVAAARASLADLATNGERVNTGLGLPTEPEYDAGAETTRPASARSINRVQMGLAALEGQDVMPFVNEGKRIDARYVHGRRRMDPKEREAQLVELNKSGEMPFTVAPVLNAKGKPTGYNSMHIVGPDGRGQQIRVGDDDLDTALYGKSLIEQGLTEEGLKVMQGVNSELARRVQEMVRTTSDVVGKNNQLQRFTNEDANDQATLGLRQRQASIESRGRPIQLVNQKTGEAALFYEGQLPVGKNGLIGMPAGYAFPKTPPEFKFQANPNGGGMFTDRTGRPVAKAGPDGEMLPLGANPGLDPEVGQLAVKHGITIGQADDEAGVPRWAYAAPDGELYGSLEEAIAAARMVAPNPRPRSRATPTEQGVRGAAGAGTFPMGRGLVMEPLAAAR